MLQQLLDPQPPQHISRQIQSPVRVKPAATQPHETASKKRRLVKHSSNATPAAVDMHSPEDPSLVQQEPAPVQQPSPDSFTEGQPTSLPSTSLSNIPDAVGQASHQAAAAEELAAEHYTDMFRHSSLTLRQQLYMHYLGLGTKGPTDTIGDGECLFRGFSQQQAVQDSDRGTAWAMSNSLDAQKGYAAARVAAATVLRSDLVIRAGIIVNAAHILEIQPILSQALGDGDHAALPDVMAAKTQLTIDEGTPILQRSFAGHELRDSPLLMHLAASMHQLHCHTVQPLRSGSLLC